jgi:hypothetical protein
VRGLSWSPDGRWLVVFAAGDGRQIAAYGTNAGILAVRWSPDRGLIWAVDNGALFGCPRAYKLSAVGELVSHPDGPQAFYCFARGPVDLRRRSHHA